MFSGFRHLALERPLVVLAVRSTGPDPLFDRVVEVAAIRCDPGGRVTRRRQLVDPGIPTEPPADKETTTRRVAAPAFAAVAPRLFELIADADLCGFKFAESGLLVLLAEFDRCGLRLPLAGRAVVDGYEAFAAKHPRPLDAAVTLYAGGPATGEPAAPGDALADAAAAAAALDGMLAAHPDLPRRPAELRRVGGRADATGRFRVAGDGDGEPTVVFGFGRHRGRPLAEVARADANYLYWMLATGFADDACRLVRAALGKD